MDVIQRTLQEILDARLPQVKRWLTPVFEPDPPASTESVTAITAPEEKRQPKTPLDPASPSQTPQEKPSKEPIATRAMARLLASQGQQARAAAIYDQLLKLTPNDPELQQERIALDADPAPAPATPAPSVVLADVAEAPTNTGSRPAEPTPAEPTPTESTPAESSLQTRIPGTLEVHQGQVRWSLLPPVSPEPTPPLTLRIETFDPHTQLQTHVKEIPGQPLTGTHPLETTTAPALIAIGTGQGAHFQPWRHVTTAKQAPASV